MGVLTVDQIVSEGQLLAGRDDNAEASRGWLGRWLNAVAASWPWPQLQVESYNFVLPAGTQHMAFGNNPLGSSEGGNENGPSYKVLKILDNCWIFNVARTARQRLRIRQHLSEPVDRFQNPSNLRVGMPSSMRILPANLGDDDKMGQWLLAFDVSPDQDYGLIIPHMKLPAAINTDSYPWYPNDETMVTLVAYKNLQFYDGEDSAATQAMKQQLAGLIAADRTRYGSVPGMNDSFSLDPTVFKRRG